MQNALCPLISGQTAGLKMDRREFLLTTSKTLFGTAALASFPLSIQKALAIDAKVETGTLQDVKHVVILTQENRSFDNYFCTLKRSPWFRGPFYHSLERGPFSLGAV
ncbi:alkaline phosphatase family protein [Acinetobacter radioresistens]|uniref:alkaline phosphatase family protein n=1 Tax=Acinetobacter radioresistens TaxID=40216 RepID=UPI0037098235